jgi:gas vesicle protein
LSEGNGGEPAVVIERRGGGGAGVFLFGLALGAGLALLFAPQSGEETRALVTRQARKFKRKARRLADSARDAAEDTRDALERRLARHHAADRDEVYEGEDEGV